MRLILRINANDEEMVDVLEKRSVYYTSSHPRWTTWACIQKDLFFHDKELREALEDDDVEIELTQVKESQ